MHNPAPVLENDTHKLLWDFDIHTDHLILARRPDQKIFINRKRLFVFPPEMAKQFDIALIIINKKKRICKIFDLAVPADHKI